MPRIKKPKVILTERTLKHLETSRMQLINPPIKATYGLVNRATGYIVARHSERPYIVAFQRDDHLQGYYGDGCWDLWECDLCLE